MKIPDKLAGAMITFGLLSLLSSAIEASTVAPMVLIRNDAGEPPPTSTKPPIKMPGADDAEKKATDNPVGREKALPPPELSLAEQHQERRTRSLFLFLQILRTAK